MRQRLLALADIARQRGDGGEFIAALKEFDRRLRVYPQFGEPLVDLKKTGPGLDLDRASSFLLLVGRLR